MRHNLQMVGITPLWLAVYRLGLPCVVNALWEFHSFFQRPLKITLVHSLNDRQMPPVRAVQGDCKRVYVIVVYDDVIKSKHFPRYWPFVRGIHWSPVNSPHKGQWRGAFLISLICAWINGWVNNRKACDLRRHRVHYDITVMCNTLGNVAPDGLC